MKITGDGAHIRLIASLETPSAILGTMGSIAAQVTYSIHRNFSFVAVPGCLKVD